MDLAGTEDWFALRLSGAFAYTTAPRWLSVCTPLITALHMARVMVDGDLMQGLQQVVAGLRDVRLRDCVVDLEGKFRRTPTWGVLWDTASRSGRLRSVDVRGCGYHHFPCPSYDEHALLVQHKQDAEALEQLQEHIRGRVVLECL
jgi:hypothetical protein